MRHIVASSAHHVHKVINHHQINFLPHCIERSKFNLILNEIRRDVTQIVNDEHDLQHHQKLQSRLAAGMD